MIFCAALACVLFGNLKHIGGDVIDGDVMPVFGKLDTDLRQDPAPTSNTLKGVGCVSVARLLPSQNIMAQHR